MTHINILLLFLLSVILLQFVSGVPVFSESNLQTINKQIEDVNYLTADNPLRNKRQAEGMDNTGDGFDSVDADAEKKPGFFDRAAKFVMEVLQRFLKWVNSDNN